MVENIVLYAVKVGVTLLGVAPFVIYVANVLKEVADVIGEVADALADGQITADEWEQIKAEADEVITELKKAPKKKK